MPRRPNSYSREEMKELRHISRNGGMKIVGVHVAWPRPIMDAHRGTEAEKTREVDQYYGNIIEFNPRAQAMDSMYASHGPDWVLNARGIYYHDRFSVPHTTVTTPPPSSLVKNRTLFIPTCKDLDWDDSGEVSRRARARVAARHAASHEVWNKSEYAWEADAWSDVFGKIRDDPLLVMDKHEYNANLPVTDPETCLLTGQRKLVKRIPDASFGLSTYRHGKNSPLHKQPVNSLALHQDRLERLAFHPKCGLVSDPKWGDAHLAFPWAVYEAKGWNGDCREARRQAISAGARYLHMLDHLARVPGPRGTAQEYQTPSSHDFQVFALTSFGSHWHVLAGFVHDRLPEQEAGTEGMAKTVTTFERIWSGRISNERGAWELLVLIDAIQEYAVGEFRDFVIRHLDAWHEYCDDTYLHEMLLVPQADQKGKRKRDDANEENVMLPRWCEFIDSRTKDKMREKAKASLRAAAMEQYEVEQSFEVKQWEPVVDEIVTEDGRVEKRARI